MTIKRPRTRSTAARQVSNAHERDLVTKSLAARELDREKDFPKGTFDLKRA